MIMIMMILELLNFLGNQLRYRICLVLAIDLYYSSKLMTLGLMGYKAFIFVIVEFHLTQLLLIWFMVYGVDRSNEYVIVFP